MREFVHEQTRDLLRSLATRVNRTARDAEPDAEAIHDLRVAVRRLSRCLRVFSQFYPGRSWKKIRRRLKELMELCGSVRDRDIAMELLRKAGVRTATPLLKQLAEERVEAGRELRRELRRWKQRGFSREWRERLEV